MAHWNETRAALRRFWGRRPLLTLGAGVTVVALGLRALAHVATPTPTGPKKEAASPSSAAPCPPRSLSDAGVCVPAPHPETALALAEAPPEESSHDSLTPDSTPTQDRPAVDPATAPTSTKLEFEPVDTSEDEKPRRALRENPPEFERGTPEESPEEIPETE